MNVIVEAKYITAATFLGLVIVFAIQYLTSLLGRSANRPSPRSSMFKTILPTSSPGLKLSTRSVAGPRSLYDPREDITRRVSFDVPDTFVYGYPSKGGAIVLENATIPDFEFLGLSRINPPKTRFSDSQSEDEFCKKLLLLGAKWYDSLSRLMFLKNVDGDVPDETCIDALEEEREPAPTERERTWVSVAWPSTGGIVVAEWNTTIWGYGRDDDRFVPTDELGRLRMCKDMDEKALILKEWFEGKDFKSIGEYVGNAWIGIWDSKEGGEHGEMQETWKSD